MLLGAIFVIGLDIYLLVMSLEILLTVTWKGTVAPSLIEVLDIAEKTAVHYGSKTCDKNHLIYALMQDETSRQLLQLGRVDIKALEHELKKGSKFLAGEFYGKQDHHHAP